MRKKKGKNNTKQELIDLLRRRLKLLKIERQHYEQNPVIMKHIKMANIELIQNDMADLEKALTEALTELP